MGSARWPGTTVAVLLVSASAGCGLLLDLDAPVPQGPTEVCNGLDDDGDGLVDEEPADVGGPCFEGPPGLAGIGQCVEGQTVCEDGAISCQGYGAPSMEICDGVDNDCDGALSPEEEGGGCGGVATPDGLRVELLVEPAQPDVHINLDTTSSMFMVLESFQRELVSGAAADILTRTPGAAFGLSTFDDFPVGSFGSAPDRPFVLHQRITADLAVLGAAVTRPMLHFGSDGPEAGVESLFQVATGAGRTWPTASGGSDSVPAVDCGEGFDPALGHGSVGGACFRPESLPVVVHVTDAPSHESSDYAPYRIMAASSAEAMDALHAIGARVLGIRTSDYAIGPDPFDPLFPEGMALATGSVVPVCAFDGSEPRLSGACMPDDCCTTLGATGRPPVPGVGCPMVFDAFSSGDGLVPAIVTGVDLLTRFTPRSISIALTDDVADGVDATCFVESIVLDSVDGPPMGCGAPAIPRDTDGDGLDDTADGVIAGERVRFELRFTNADTRDVDGDGDRAEPCGPVGDYPLEVAVVADGVAVLSSQTETITVR